MVLMQELPPPAATMWWRFRRSHAEIEVLRRPPDLIFPDVVVPGKTGYELP
jgi:hypothetical protein